MAVELIYDADCPNITAAREQLLKAFVATGLTPQWQEWDRNDPNSPPYSQLFGSPTILVNGHDVVEDQAMADSDCCRLYIEGNRYQGVPPLKSVVSALNNYQHNNSKQNTTHSNTRKTGLAGIISLLPTVGLAALPKVFCPACWPAYSALLGAMGIGFVDYTPYMLPFTALFLVIVIAMLGVKATQRRGYSPLIVGLSAALIILFGKFYFESNAALYTGVALLMLAAIWNAWPLRANNAPCPACHTLDKTPGGST